MAERAEILTYTFCYFVSGYLKFKIRKLLSIFSFAAFLGIYYVMYYIF